jgi:ABC-2 type transport system ATP-binding protein
MQESTATPALQLWGVVKRYGLVNKTTALSEVSLQVARGECFGLAGPNGAGKTTLIKLLLGLTQPDEGEVRLFGQRPDDPEVRRRIGFVPESAELPPAASPRQLVRRLARLRGLETRLAVSRGMEQLDRLGLAGLFDRPAGKLSKGEKQRTLLALALLPDPELLILDEPTDGLDPLGRALVRRVLHEELARGRTVFLNSHLLSETERICTRVAILHKGRLVREELIQERPSGASEIVLAEPPPVETLRSMGARLLEGNTIIVEHEDLKALNFTLDQLRASGALIDEVRRVRQDLEATFAEAVTGAAQEPAAKGPPPPEPEQLPGSILRGPKATLRVTGEIIADLIARKAGWVALAAALLFIGAFLWVLHHDLVGGAAVMAHRWASPGGLTDESHLGEIAGGYVASTVYWSLLPGSLIFAALFAPPLLDPRRSILILSQPVSRGDLAAGIYAAVCSFILAEYVFLAALLFGGLRYLKLQTHPRFLLTPLPLLFAFAAIYIVQLGFTYLLRSGPAAASLGLAMLIASAALGFADGARPGAPLSVTSVCAALLPRIASLAEQSMRLGSDGLFSFAPFLLTALFITALGLVTLHAAERSEQ